MALCWPTAADTADRAENVTFPIRLAAAESPGSDQVYHPGQRQWRPRTKADTRHVTLLGVAGLLGSVCSAAREPQTASAMLVRISSTEWSLDISPASLQTTAYRTSQLTDVQAWLGAGFDASSARDLGETLQTTLRRPQWLSTVRLPGRQDYLAALDQAVYQALDGSASPADCLQAAADRWREIGQQRGAAGQQAAYHRSVGLEP